MEYQEIINPIDDRLSQPSKLTVKNWVEINDDERKKHNTDS